MRLKVFGVFLVTWASPVLADGAAGVAGVAGNQVNVAVSIERGVRVWRPLDTDGAYETPAYSAAGPSAGQTTVYSSSYGYGIYVPGYGYGRPFGNHHVKLLHQRNHPHTNRLAGVNVFHPAIATNTTSRVVFQRTSHGQAGRVYKAAGPMHGFGGGAHPHAGSHRMGHAHR